MAQVFDEPAPRDFQSAQQHNRIGSFDRAPEREQQINDQERSTRDSAPNL
jgi:hypothetical protein